MASRMKTLPYEISWWKAAIEGALPQERNGSDDHNNCEHHNHLHEREAAGVRATGVGWIPLGEIREQKARSEERNEGHLNTHSMAFGATYQYHYA